jgi:hypothetical protein
MDYTSTGSSPSFSAQFSFDSSPDEMIFGTGQHQDHILNQKGQTIDLVHFKVRLFFVYCRKVLMIRSQFVFPRVEYTRRLTRSIRYL